MGPPLKTACGSPVVIHHNVVLEERMHRENGRRACLTLIALLGCGGSSAGGDASTDAAPAAPPKFVVCAASVSPTGTTGLIYGIDSLAEGEVGLGEGVEVGGMGPTCSSAFGAAFGATSEGNIVQRFEPDELGRLVPTDSVSFGPAGISSISSGRAGAFLFLSETEALYIDRRTGTFVRWNPAAMTFTDSFRIEEIDGPGISVVRVRQGAVDNHLLLFVRYQEDGIFLKRSILVNLNLSDFTYTLDEDTRCGGLFSHVRTSDGTTYFASGTFIASYDVLGIGDDPPAPCMLRVLPGESEFDDSFFMELNDLTGMPTGNLLPAGGDSAFVLAYDTTAVDPSGVFTPLQFAREPSWRLFRVEDVGTSTSATLVESVPLRTGLLSEVVSLEGRRYQLRANEAEGRSTYVDITDIDNPIDGVRFLGAGPVSVTLLGEPR
ncbi:MAG: hypothetical protein AAGE52_25195 [Myxococcota bacterium]